MFSYSAGLKKREGLWAMPKLKACHSLCLVSCVLIQLSWQVPQVATASQKTLASDRTNDKSRGSAPPSGPSSQTTGVGEGRRATATPSINPPSGPRAQLLNPGPSTEKPSTNGLNSAKLAMDRYVTHLSGFVYPLILS